MAGDEMTFVLLSRHGRSKSTIRSVCYRRELRLPLELFYWHGCFVVYWRLQYISCQPAFMMICAILPLPNVERGTRSAPAGCPSHPPFPVANTLFALPSSSIWHSSKTPPHLYSTQPNLPTSFPPLSLPLSIPAPPASIRLSPARCRHACVGNSSSMC